LDGLKAASPVAVARPARRLGEGNMNTRHSISRSSIRVTSLVALALLAGACAPETADPEENTPDLAGSGQDTDGAVGEDTAAVQAAGADDYRWMSDFDFDHGWRVGKHERDLVDVDGDGLLDAVGFNDVGVYVARSLGDRFDAPSLWHDGFSYTAGYRVGKHLRFVADVDSDHRGDIVAFFGDGVWVARSQGDRFGPAERWLDDFGHDQGWRADRHLRRVVDLNRDGLVDIVAFGDDGVHFALATRGGFEPPILGIQHFNRDAGWRYDRQPVDLVDFDGDGYPDIGGISDDGVWVSRFARDHFAEPVRWSAQFGADLGWRWDKHPRMFADVDGDGRADVVGFHDLGPYVALSTGAEFASPRPWGGFFGYRTGNWRMNSHVRRLVDVDGDRKADLVGIHDDGVWVGTSLGTSFAEPVLQIEDFSRRHGWDSRRDLRLFADMLGDHRGYIAGFGKTGVFVKGLW
jgi:hypothetical protein